MAHRLTNLVYKTAALVTVLMLLSGSMAAQNNKPVKVNESAVKNLVAGINSENIGLKKSSIYLAGKYKLAELMSTLAEKLEDEKDANTRILIALSLYQIGINEGMDAIKEAAVKDNEAKVRKMCSEIYNAFVQNSYTVTEKY
jgi:HEAT repeat protein